MTQVINSYMTASLVPCLIDSVFRVYFDYTKRRWVPAYITTRNLLWDQGRAKINQGLCADPERLARGGQP